jgi:hypothetical protein
LKEVAQNASIVLISLVVTTLALEVAFRGLLPWLPLRFRGYLPLEAAVVAQNSKSGFLPSDYVAILGDSYAEGGGDGLWDVQHSWGVPDYASHQLLHHALGRDVVTLGESGASSITALLLLPENLTERIGRGLPGELEPPSLWLVYFYEGNDLDDNLAQIASVTPEADLPRALALETDLAAALDRVVSAHFMSEVRWYHAFWMLRSVHNAWRSLIREARPHPLARDSGANRVVVDGETLVLPDRLQAPALELADEQIDLSIRAFELALRRLAERHAETEIAVVYIPAPLSCYALATQRVSAAGRRPSADGLHDAARVEANSDRIADGIRLASERNGATFVDLRAPIRTVTREEPVHGPLDFAHFNRRGYELLTEVVSATIETRLPGVTR